MSQHPILRKHVFLETCILIFFCLSACDFANGIGLSSGPTIKWQVHIGSRPDTRVVAPVAVANGTVFVAAVEADPGRYPWDTNIYLQALNANNGRFKWHFEGGGHSAARPVMQNGIVTFSSFPFSPLYGVDVETGVPKWKFSVSNQYLSQPVARDGVVYMACECRRYAGLGPNGRVLAIDAESGKAKWEIDQENPKDISPAVSTDMVYYVDGEGLHAVDRETGKERWAFHPEQLITSAPAVVNDTVYFGAPADALPRLFALDAKTGTELWRIAMEQGAIWSVTIIHDTAYVGVFVFRDMFSFGATSYLYAVDLLTRNIKWRFDDGSPMGVVEGDGTLYFSSSKNLYAIDEATGRTKWTFHDGQNWNAPTLEDSIIYIGGDKGDLYAISVP